MPQTHETLPDRVRMPLLELVAQESLDADYVDAARRRAEAGEPDDTGDPHHPHRRTPLRGAAVATAVFGLMIALAAVQTSRDSGVQEASRQALVDRIDQRRAEVDGLEERADGLERDLRVLRSGSGALRSAVGETTVLLRSLEIASGFVDVTGPGVRITVDDSPDGSADGRIRATDLRLLVNGLWQAGAEAISVNGRRLTSVSPIANSNIAILVNRQPLTPPYVVTAIGDPRTLQADLLATTTGRAFQSLAEQFGFEVDSQDEDDLEIPSASDRLLRLRFAQEDSGVPDNQQQGDRP